jgi:hypothetical protein
MLEPAGAIAVPPIADSRVRDPGAPGFWGQKCGWREKARNEMAVKSLKTHGSAKSLISRPNDFKDLRPRSRNRSLRLAKHSFRFRRFFASPALETQPAVSRACALREPLRGLRRFANAGGGAPRDKAEKKLRNSSSCSGGAAPLGTDRNLAMKKLRESAAKLLKSLARVTLCASPSGRLRRRRRGVRGPLFLRLA